MPTPTTAKLPKPRNEDEFEDIVVDFLRLRWKDPNAQRNGRRGQGQHGVDVIGHPPWLDGKMAGGQCKNTEEVTLKMVIAEVDKAIHFPGGLAEFYFVTSADRDAPLQSAVRLHFKAHPAPFDVEVLFWQDVTADLAQDEDLVAKHWKGFGGKTAFRDQLLIIKTEALRMQEHAERLNAGIAHRHGDLAITMQLKFRPAVLETSLTPILARLADQRVLLTSLEALRGAASAADSEVDRILVSGVGTFERLRDLLLLVMSNAAQSARCIDQVLAAGR